MLRPRGDGPSLAPVAAAFMCFGAFWGSWAVTAIDVERFLHLTDAGLGTLLAAAVVGGAVTNAVGGTLAERFGTRAVLSISLAGWSAALLALSAVHDHWAFMGLFVVAVAVGGGADVVMNVAAAAALSTEPGRLLRFHALFNTGAVLGAAATAGLERSGASWRVEWAAVGLVAAAISLFVATTELHAGERGERVAARQGVAALVRAGLVGLAVAFALAAMVEGGIDTWGVLFLRSRLALGILAGAAAYAVGQSLATGARASLGRFAGRGSGRGAATGAALAAVGLVVEGVSPWAPLAAAGLALAAVGISMCWPLFLAEATAGEDRPAVLVGGITAAGYVGFVAGPPIVGWLSSAIGLRWGLLSLGVAAGAAAVLPRRRRPALA